MKICILPLMMAVALMGAGPVDTQQPLTITLEGLRSSKGHLMICVTHTPKYFPDCTGDPDGRHMIVPTSAGPIALGSLPPGTYAIAIVHDENSNGKLDTFAGIPREGVGFSRNPALRFGAPSFKSAQFTVGGAPVRQAIKLKYFL